MIHIGLEVIHILLVVNVTVAAFVYTHCVKRVKKVIMHIKNVHFCL
jgi:hypothetical protein